MRWDVAVVGAGPAGWAIGSSFVTKGLKTVLIAPEPRADWPNNYGVWHDDIEDAQAIAEHVWPKVEVRFDADRVHVFDRPYVRISNAKLQTKLRQNAEAGGLREIAATVLDATHDEDGTTLRLEATDGGSAEVRAVLVIDATGHQPRLVRTRRGRPPGMQVAYGVQARLEAGHVDPDRMVLMDFSADHLPAGEREPPTFLYSMPFGDGRVFVEETSLVGRPQLDLAECERRLAVRMRARGWKLGPAEEVERCFIPMGGPEPKASQRVVPFGGAAATVHPATGYMIANVLRDAPRIADAVFEVRDQKEPDYWSRIAWRSVWSPDRRRAWAFYRYGMEVLINMDVSSTARFFDTFFKIRPDYWQGYMSGDVSSGRVASAMWALFSKASPGLRWQLMSKGFYALMPAVPS